jgi:hypothetical protein
MKTISIYLFCTSLFLTISLSGTAQYYNSNTNNPFIKQNNLKLITLGSYKISSNVFAANSFDYPNPTSSNLNLLQENVVPNIHNSKNYSATTNLNAIVQNSQNPNTMKIKESFNNSEFYNKNRRLIYSSLWAFASLNYKYCDLVTFMDAKTHLQYHSGTVNGFEMSPNFLAASAVFMQIPLANVFLPHVIKNDNTLRWVQIVSGAVMTLVQTASLFSVKPTPYYAVFSTFEIATTAFITFDAIRWKPKQNPTYY